ncbi:MAG: hypothetical protein M3083_15375 [Actinomycetota bacterium]|nr:hypothetical protein [Actinomycetota bacterium]
MTARPDSAQQWRDAAAVFGTADWDTGALHDAAVVDADKAGAHAGDAAAALAGDRDAAARLGVAGVVAVRAAAAVFEVEETVDGWTLTASGGTPDVADLAMAAAIRATQVGAQRRGEEWR